jgi:hypothetical protein
MKSRLFKDENRTLVDKSDGSGYRIRYSIRDRSIATNRFQTYSAGPKHISRLNAEGAIPGETIILLNQLRRAFGLR